MIIEKQLRMSELIKELGSHLTPFFQASAQFEKLFELTNLLPPLSGAGFEVHLTQEEERTDFLIRAGVFDGGREAVSNDHSHFSFDETLCESSQWKNIMEFAKQWNDPHSLVYHGVENIWFEFDLPNTKGFLNTPSFFFDVNRSNQFTELKEKQLMEQVLSFFSEHNHSRLILNILHYLKLGPPTIRIEYLGKMLSRATNDLRLCLGGFQKEQVIPFLESIAWRGDLSSVKKILECYAKNSYTYILDFDLGDDLSPTLGIECFFDQQKYWDVSLNDLVEAGLCSPESRTNLLSWSGFNLLSNESLKGEFSAAMQADIQYLIRRLNHIKFSITQSSEINTKAYLYYCYA